MAITCENCGNENLNAVIGDTCAVCSSVLGPVKQEIPPSQGNGVLLPSQTQPSLTCDEPKSADLLFRFRTFGLKFCEGTVINIQSLPDDKPDAEISMILLKTLLFLDVFLIMGAIGLTLLGASLIFIIIGLIFSIGCILPMAAIMGQIFIVAFIRMLGSVTGNKNQQLLPVSNYIIQTTAGKIVTVRIKGRLRGAAPQKSDHIKVWGVFKDGIIHFRYGVNENTDEPYLLPDSFRGIWLAILILLNLVFGLWIFFQSPASHGM